jgi:hypothetical protein
VIQQICNFPLGVRFSFLGYHGAYVQQRSFPRITGEFFHVAKQSSRHPMRSGVHGRRGPRLVANEIAKLSQSRRDEFLRTIDHG